VQAHHVLRALGEGGDLVEVQRGGVGGQDGTRLAHAVELLEYLLLDAHVLEHGFDHQVHIRQVGIVQRGLQQRHARVELVLRELALLERVLVVLADGADAALQRFGLGLQHDDGDAGIEEVHRDAAPHGARADDAHLDDGAHGCVGRHVADFAGSTFGGKHMAQRARFGRLHQGQEAFAFDLLAFIEGLVRGSGHGFQALQRCREVLGHRAHGVAGELQEGLGVGLVHLAIAHTRQPAAFLNHLVGQGQRGGQQFAVHHFVEQGRGLQLGRGHLGARDDHVQRGFQTDHAGQALGSARARQQAQLHLGQRHGGIAAGDAEMAAQGQLQSAPHAHAADGGNDGLDAALDGGDDRQQRGLLHRLGRAELAHIGTTGEEAFIADQHHGLHRRIGRGRVDAGHDGLTHGQAQAIDGRVVEGDHGHGAVQ